MPQRRIVIATETFEPEMGGGETQARTLSDSLTARGFAVTLVTRRSRGYLPRRERQGELTIIRVAPAGPGRWKKWVLMVSAFPALFSASRGATAILVSGFRFLGFPAVLATRMRGAPCFLKGDNRGELSGEYFRAGLAQLGMTPRSLPVRWLVAARNMVLRRAEGFVALSHEMAAEFEELGVPADRIHEIPNGVDTSHFRPTDSSERNALRERLGFPDGPVALYTGRLVSHKGLLVLVHAWEKLLQTMPGATLYLVGEGGADMHNCEAELRQFARERNLESRIRFAGLVPHVVDFLRAADAFVFPTLDDSFGISLVEAMACELPVVSSPVGGIRDFLVDGVNGFLAPAGDANALADALGRVLGGGPHMVAAGRAARETVIARFSHDAVARSYLAMFEAAHGAGGA